MSSAARPRLLFLSQTLPYPPDGGVKIRTYNILRLLARNFDITALCFYRVQGMSPGRSVADAVRALSAFCHIEAFPIPQEHNRARLVWDHVRSLVNRRAYTVYSYQSSSFATRLGELLKTSAFDLVHADSLDLSPYFSRVAGLPLVCVHHDTQSLLLARRAAVERSPLRRAYVKHQAALMRAEEQRWCPHVSMNVCVSQVDAKALREVAGKGRYEVVPNGVDTEYFSPSSGATAGPIVFVGGTTWHPNRDALHYFVEAILPQLRALGVSAPVRWVGRATEDEKVHFRNEHGIEMLGYVDDIRPHVANAACYIVPIRIGGGTRVKILDAWAMGLPVVSTSIGCEGLNTRDGINIVVRDDPAGFAKAIKDVLESPTLRAELSYAARDTAARQYGWDAIGRGMAILYCGLVRSRGPVPPQSSP